MTRARAIVYLLALGALALAFVAVAQPHPAASDTSTAMNGAAWSDTIGWVSLSGSGYGFLIGSDGTLSGYAWSDNIGWISANSADLAGCPAAPCTARETNGVFSGWLKALATGGGWDGFISLSGSGYGVVENNGVVSGYAWGDTNVGWVDFEYTTPFGPACTLTATPANIVKGNNVSLAWSSSRSTSGTITPGSITATPVASGATGVAPTATTTYTATFTGAGGSAQCSATVGVQCAPVYACSGASITYTNSACATSTITSCASPSFCSAGMQTCQWPAIETTPNGSFSGHLQAQPDILDEGQTTKLFWNISQSSGCTVSGGGQTWNTLSSGPSGVTTNPISQKTTYTIHCTAYQDKTDLNESLDVLVRPSFEEK